MLADDSSGPRARLAARSAAAAVALLALVELSQYVFGWNAGVDELLFDDRTGAVGTSHPGRMAPNAALAFVLCGAALLLFDRSSGLTGPRRCWRPWSD